MSKEFSIPLPRGKFILDIFSKSDHNVEAYPGFRSMKRLGVFLLPPGWDASPSQGYPRHWIRRYPFMHLGGERHRESSVLFKNTAQCPRPGLEPGPLNLETRALAIRPPRLPNSKRLVYSSLFATNSFKSLRKLLQHCDETCLLIWGFVSPYLRNFINCLGDT